MHLLQLRRSHRHHRLTRCNTRARARAAYRARVVYGTSMRTARNVLLVSRLPPLPHHARCGISCFARRSARRRADVGVAYHAPSRCSGPRPTAHTCRQRGGSARARAAGHKNARCIYVSGLAGLPFAALVPRRRRRILYAAAGAGGLDHHPHQRNIVGSTAWP